MILISSNITDYTTNLVIEWLNFYNKKFLRINEEDSSFFSIKDDNIFIEIDDKKINLNDINSYWYRRGTIKINLNKGKIFDEYFLEQERVFTDYINHFLLTKEKKLNNIRDNEINKLKVLKHAESIGIKTPKTYIINNKNDLSKIINIHKKIITKNISGSGMFNINGKINVVYTKELSFQDLFLIPNVFYPSLFQEKIEKKYEIRTFYIKERFYSIAILSQGSDQTSVDYRKYNIDNPNRTIPYILNENLQEKIKQLMIILNLDSGSIDFIVDKEDNLYFLEVNPVGQFSNVSIIGNYYLEELIAKEL